MKQGERYTDEVCKTNIISTISPILALNPPNPQGERKERSHERLGKNKKQLKKGKRKQSVARAKKSILPISTPCKQTAGFTLHNATKNLYRISERFVQYLAQRASQYPQNPQKVLEE